MARKKKPTITFAPVAFAADIHLGNFKQFGGPTIEDGINTRGRITIETLQRALKKASRLGCKLIVIGGDLFHHRRPEPAIIAAANRVFDEAESDRLTVHVIPGNHDTIDSFTLGGNTACATVEQTATVWHGWNDVALDADRLDAEQCIQAYMRLIPFNGGSKPMAQFIDEVCSNFKAKGVLRALATHVGVVDDDTPPWLRDAQDAMHKDKLFDVMDREDIAVAFVGNYHKHQEWERGGRKIVQVGVLNPTGFADDGLADVGGLATWDGNEVLWGQVPGPRFVKVARGQEMPASPVGCAVFVRTEEAWAGTTDHEYAGFEVVDEATPVVAEEEPSKLVESAEDALKEWVDKVLLVDGLGKGEVLDELQRLWRKAS